MSNHITGTLVKRDKIIGWQPHLELTLDCVCNLFITLSFGTCLKVRNDVISNRSP